MTTRPLTGEASVSHDQVATRIKDTFDAWMANDFTKRLLLALEESRVAAQENAMTALQVGETSQALRFAGHESALAAALETPALLLKEWLDEHRRALLADSLHESASQAAADVQGEYEDDVAGDGGAPRLQRGGDKVQSGKPFVPSRVTYPDGYTVLGMPKGWGSARTED